MPSAKKGKRKSKPPARLKEFLCEDFIEKEMEPRRSRRIPKISERLKRYMDDSTDGAQGSNQGRKEPRIIVPSDHDLLGSEYRDPKVVLKALPKSLLQKGTRKFPGYKREISVNLKRLNNTVGNIRESSVTLKRLGNTVGLKRETSVTLKRLGNSGGSKKSSRIYTSKLHKQKAGLTRGASVPSSSSSQDDLSSSTGKPLQSTRGKRKRVSAGHNMQPKEKHTRTSPRVSEHKDKDEKMKKEMEDSKLDPDVMTKLFNFGVKVKEVMTLNKEAINKLNKDNDRTQSFTQVIGDKLQNINESDYDQILSWLDEEEQQRKKHREKVMESLRVSHSTNIALYSHMLTVLQSVTASI